MSEAAASGNSAYIPHLRPKLRSRDFVEAEAAKIALIKLHDQETMQRMYCEVKAFGGADYAFAINELPKIGGWFSISLLRAAIVENDQIHSRVKWPPSDAIVAEPASYAVDALPKLIKNPDRPKSDVPGADERLSALSWVKWIDDHQETLSKLEPTGNDYTFTDDACKKKR